MKVTCGICLQILCSASAPSVKCRTVVYLGYRHANIDMEYDLVQYLVLKIEMFSLSSHLQSIFGSSTFKCKSLSDSL